MTQMRTGKSSAPGKPVTALVRAQFGEMLKGLILLDNWRDEILRQMLAEAQSQGILLDSMEREKERLKLKRTRILKQYREGYIDDDEFYGEMAAVELALHQLQTPEVNGVKFDDVIAAGEHIPGMAALWDEAIPEERREMVMLLLEPGGLYYDLELKLIAALKPRPAFLPILRMLTGVVEYDEAKGILVTENWQDRNRRASDYLQAYQRDRQTHAANPRFLRIWLYTHKYGTVLATWDIRSEKSRTDKQAERRCLLFVRERKIRQGRQKRALPLKPPLAHSVKSSSLPFANTPSTIYTALW